MFRCALCRHGVLAIFRYVDAVDSKSWKREPAVCLPGLRGKLLKLCLQQTKCAFAPSASTTVCAALCALINLPPQLQRKYMESVIQALQEVRSQEVCMLMLPGAICTQADIACMVISMTALDSPLLPAGSSSSHSS